MTELNGEPRDAGTRKGPRRRRRWPWLTAGAAIGVGLVVLFWFQPQKLLMDERVEEAIPTATGGTAEPVELARSDFVSIDHGTSGVARVLESADGTRIVRLEGLDTSNGPDLFLYLSTNPADGEEGAFDDDVVNLGRLKGNQGDQTYDLPADADLTRFASIVIWCDRFNSAFGAAELTLT